MSESIAFLNDERQEPLLNRLLARLGLWQVIRIVAYILMICCLLVGLGESQWLRRPAVLWWAAGGGLIAGLLLGSLLRRVSIMLPTLLLSGLIFVGLLQSRTLPPLDAGWQETLAVAGWAAAETRERVEDLAIELLDLSEDPAQPPRPRPATPEWEAASARFSIYLLNLRDQWPPTLQVRRWSQGQLLLGSILALLVWAVSGSTLWALLRGATPVARFIPVLLLLGWSVYYEADGWPYLLGAIFLGLLLSGDQALQAVMKRWPEGLLYPGLEVEWAAFAVLLAALPLIVMFLALEITNPELRRWVDATLSPAPGEHAQPATLGSRPELQRGGVWPQERLVGGEIDLSTRPAFFIHTPGAPPASFYWRATVYDQYTGSGWLQSSRETLEEADPASLWPTRVDPPAGYALLRQDVTLLAEGHQIYAAGQPVRVSVPAYGIWSDAEGSDLIAVMAESSVSGYQVLSWVPAFSAAELRGSEGDIPEALGERYLQLPEALPMRVGRLTAELIAEAETDYDRALAIQNYLRSLEYSLSPPRPIAEQDLVDFFLFESQVGYCDYFATAMVIMARQAGIPARLAVGYRSGVYDDEVQGYEVTLADAHSWPELYFAGRGWITFEPTAAFPAPDPGLPANWDYQPPPEVTDPARWEIQPPQRVERGWQRPLLLTVAGLLLAFSLSAIGVAVAKRVKQKDQLPAQIIAGAYGALLMAARRLGLQIDGSQTPYEIQDALLIRIDEIQQSLPPGLAERLDPAPADSTTLIGLYVQMQYSQQDPGEVGAQKALRLWRSLRGLLRLARLAGWMQRIGARLRLSGRRASASS